MEITGVELHGPLHHDPYVISGESGAVSLGALMYIMQHPSGKVFRDELKLGLDSQVLLINSEGSTSLDDFRYVVWEGAFRCRSNTGCIRWIGSF